MADLPKINPPFATPNDPNYAPYNRDPETLVRQWAVPGMEGLRHRIGGLEKLSGKGSVSTDNANHQEMVNYRKEKVEGDREGDEMRKESDRWSVASGRLRSESPPL